MRLEHQITHPRLLRKAARGDGPAKATAGDAADGRKASRFVDATLIDQERKAAILSALQQRQIGDELGREIFVAAVEYQLTAFAHHLASAPLPTPEPDPGLQVAAERAQAFVSLLEHLPEKARRLLAERLAETGEGRQTAGQDRLCELGCEIAHLERACRSAAEAPQPAAGPELELVGQLARAFAACFEETPSAAPDGAFATTLQVLVEQTGLAIPHSPGLLGQALAGPAQETLSAPLKGRA